MSHAPSSIHLSKAETVTDILAETRATDLADVATRADQGGPRRIGNQIIKWLVPLLLGQAGLIVALIKLLP